MAVGYQQLLRNVALRMSALVGSQVATITATYDTAPLTAAQFKSADWPFNSFRDAILMAVEEFAWAIADVKDHTWRATIGDVTAALANKAELPTSSASAKPIIGVWGDVFDSVDGKLLTDELDLATLRRLVDSAWRTLPVYYYKITGHHIIHTRTSVEIDCCVFSRTDELATWNANGNMVLPDVLEPGITSRAISLMTRDGAFAQQAERYAVHSNEALAAVRLGQTTIPKAP